MGEGFTRAHHVLAGLAVDRSGCGGRSAAGTRPHRHAQAGAGHHHVGVADAVELDQPVHARAHAIGDVGEGLAALHRVGARCGGSSGGAGASRARDHQAGAGDDHVGVADAIGLHEAVEAHPVAIGDFGEGFAAAHGGAAPLAGTAAARAGASRARDHQAGAGDDHVGVADAIGLHEAVEAHPVAIGDFGEGFTRFHHHIGAGAGSQQSARGQHHR